MDFNLVTISYYVAGNYIIKMVTMKLPANYTVIIKLLTYYTIF